MKKRSVDDPEHNWWEKSLQTRRLQLAASATAITAGNTTWTLAAGEDATQLKEGDILKVLHTGEQVRVVADPTSATSVTVTRGWGGTACNCIRYDCGWP